MQREMDRHVAGDAVVVQVTRAEHCSMGMQPMRCHAFTRSASLPHTPLIPLDCLQSPNLSLYLLISLLKKGRRLLASVDSVASH